jgi:hypothetical protein
MKRTMTGTRFPLHPGVKYEDLPEQAKAGLAALERAADDPKTKRAMRALDIWTDTLTDEEKQWLRHTEAGRKEMWQRIGLAFKLTAALESSKP